MKAVERLSGHPLFALLAQLEAERIPFTLGRYRPDTILVSLTLVGARVEVDVFDDGHMDVARFVGDEGILGGLDMVTALIREYSS
jgi:hypothetical protein